MKELNIMEALFDLPQSTDADLKEDGSQPGPICFVSYLSFNPPMVGFATGKQSHTGKRYGRPAKSSSLFPVRVWLAQQWPAERLPEPRPTRWPPTTSR